jgi:hypothetical protein
MPRVHLILLNGLVRSLRLAALGVAGSLALLVLVAVPAGALYVWFMTGASPVAQVHEGGWAVLLFWPIVGALFAGLHIAGALMAERPNGAWGVAGVTLCLLALWVLAMRRSRAYQHTILQRHG